MMDRRILSRSRLCGGREIVNFTPERNREGKRGGQWPQTPHLKELCEVTGLNKTKARAFHGSPCVVLDGVHRQSQQGEEAVEQVVRIVLNVCARWSTSVW